MGEIFHNNFSRDRNLDGNFLQLYTIYNYEQLQYNDPFFHRLNIFRAQREYFLYFIFSTQFFPKAQFLYFIR